MIIVANCRLLVRFAVIAFLFAMPPSAEALVQPAYIPTMTGTTALLRNRKGTVVTSPTKKSFRPPPFFRCPSTSCTGCLPEDLMICQAVGDLSDGDSASSMSSDEDTTTSPRGRFAGLQQRVFPRRNSGGMTLKERLLKASNFASFLCVLDCTILPLITVVLPLFGIVAASPAQMEWLHELGHQLALWFVLPVGGVATTMNYINHGKTWIAALGYFGLTAVVAANVGCHAVHLPGALGHVLHEILHTLHHGILHRVTNLAGCAMLLTSNYLSHKQGGCKDPSCSHDHDHMHKPTG